MRWVIPIIIVLLLTNISLATKLKVNEFTEVGNKNITVLGIGSDSIKISVNDQRAILKLDETKVINGIKITVFEIFYAGDEDIDYTDITTSLTYTCGDNKCDEEEKDSCCLDCGCPKGYECDNNKCELIPECEKDIDCNDDNQNTEDKCKQGNCFNIFVCTSNSQCEDNNECTKDYCEDGTCFNEDIPNCATTQPSVNEEVTTEEKEEPMEKVEDIKEEKTLEIPQEEKKGFFSKVINFFKKLFTGKLFV